MNRPPHSELNPDTVRAIEQSNSVRAAGGDAWLQALQEEREDSAWGGRVDHYSKVARTEPAWLHVGHEAVAAARRTLAQVNEDQPQTLFDTSESQ